MSKNNEHISSSAFKKYLSEKSTSADKAAFEGDIEEGSFEAEALEGFNSIENSAETVAAINAIDKEVAKRTGFKKERKFVIPIWKTMGIAASVLLFVGLAYVMTNKLSLADETVAKNETKSTENQIEESLDVLSDEMVIEEFTDSGMVELVEAEIEDLELEEDALNDIVPAPAPEVVFDIENNGQSVATDKDFLDMPKEKATLGASEDVIEEVLEDETVEYAPVTTTVSEVESSNAYGDDVMQDLESAKKTSALNRSETKAEGSNSYFNIAKVNLNSKNYNSAIDYFQRSIDNNQNVMESNYYIGFSYYNLNKNVKANKYFNIVINANSSWASNAKWYKALIYEEKGDKAAAKELLEDLANGNSGFKNQAQDKLNAY